MTDPAFTATAVAFLRLFSKMSACPPSRITSAERETAASPSRPAGGISLRKALSGSNFFLSCFFRKRRPRLGDAFPDVCLSFPDPAASDPAAPDPAAPCPSFPDPVFSGRHFSASSFSNQMLPPKKTPSLRRVGRQLLSTGTAFSQPASSFVFPIVAESATICIFGFR